MLITLIGLSLFLSLLVGIQGDKKEIGFLSSFLISVFFTPVIGLLFVIASERDNSGVKPLKNYSSPSGEAKTFYDRAMDKYQNGHYEEAIEDLEVANGLQPNNPVILIGLAHNFAVVGNNSEAIDYIERAVKNGYDNFKRIQVHEDFGELRSTAEFKEFVKDGYSQN